MSRFAAKAATFEQSDQALELDCTCSQCGRMFNGSDRSGGHIEQVFGRSRNF